MIIYLLIAIDFIMHTKIDLLVIPVAICKMHNKSFEIYWGGGLCKCSVTLDLM